jgi:inhibitor of cysteine peptidase
MNRLREIIINSLLGCFLIFFSIKANAVEGITLKVNPGQDSFVVSLAANPSTGYQWTVLSFDKSLLTLTGSGYQKPNKTLIGAGGTMVFNFALKSKGSYPTKTIIKFQYGRSWDPDSVKTQNVTVDFGQ